MTSLGQHYQSAEECASRCGFHLYTVFGYQRINCNKKGMCFCRCAHAHLCDEQIEHEEYDLYRFMSRDGSGQAASPLPPS